MYDNLISWFKQYNILNYDYDYLLIPEILEFFNNIKNSNISKIIIDYNITNSNYYYFIGIFFRCDKIWKNYDLMKQYYLIAIEKNNTGAMNKLGCYYYSIEKNYDLMKKYYLMAIENGNIISMYCLGNYYFELIKDNFMNLIDKGYFKIINIENINLMKKYFFMAIKNDNYKSCIILCYYYRYIKKNIIKQKNII